MLLEQFRVDDRVAVITGASRGIGAASAVALAEAGADVVIAARNAETLAGVARQVEKHGRRAEVVPADLADLDELPRLVDVATGRFGRLDIVVNNVGGALPREFVRTRARHLDEALRFNVLNAFELTRLALPHLLEAGGHGAVVNISSTMGRLRDRGYLAYSTAKAALTHMSRAMAIDLAPRVRVNVVAPGAVETEALGTVLDDRMRETMLSLTPMRRLGRVEDIAAAVVYLVSDASSYVTGKVLEVDGGIETPNAPLGLPDL
jgi:7-alpha-hydroxysteroid dehydrogenase